MSDDLDGLIRDLGTIPQYSQRFIHAALKKTAFDAKGSWQMHAAGPSGAHAARYPPSIDFDVKGDFPTYEAEIGPNIERYGGKTGKGGLIPSMGILEEANGGVRAAPQNARPKVIKDVSPDFEKGLDKAIGDALKRAGL